MTQAQDFIASMREIGLIVELYKGSDIYTADKCTGKQYKVIRELKNKSEAHALKINNKEIGSYPEHYWFKDLSKIFIANTFTDYALKVG